MWPWDLSYQFAVLNTKLDRILSFLSVLQQQEKKMAADLTTLTAQVKANTDAEASAVLLLTQLSDLLKSVATDPAKVQARADQLKGSADALAAAITANTPAAPPTP